MIKKTTSKPATARDIFDTLLHSKKPRFTFSNSHIRQTEACWACGNRAGFIMGTVLDDELSKSWDISPSIRRSFDVRESSNCRHCKSSRRSQFHSRAICKILAPSAKNLIEAVAQSTMRELSIAEINACGAIHHILTDLPKLSYSEYIPSDPNIRREDLHNLTYNPDSLDAVLTSDTLEHVPDWRRALEEIQRVLKPGGVHIFTVPAILTRQTRTRAVLENGHVTHLLPPTYHGCTHAATSDYVVFNEFGADFRRQVDGIGFETKIYYPNLLRLSDPNFVYVSTKV
jgi:hypothetical protein